MRVTENLRINPTRLAARFAALTEAGSTRLAFTQEDRRGRQCVIAMMERAGLDVKIDAATNIIGRRKGLRTERPAIVTGSHIDTVPGGGCYDGALGVLAAIECVETLNDLEIETHHSIETIAFANEEGQSFEGLMGSKAMVGALSFDTLNDTDAAGRTLAEALDQFGGASDSLSGSIRKSSEIKAYIELHVEQGGILELSGSQIGIVEGIVGIQYIDVIFNGEPNHAGTTPMELRKDALVAASRFIVEVDESIRTNQFSRVATVGVLHLTPNARNIVPGKVHLTAGIRDLDIKVIDQTIKHLSHCAEQISKASGVQIQIRKRESIAPALADPTLMDALKTVVPRLDLAYRVMPSGAGHDAQMMASLAPMCMIFVPSTGGISHSTDEFTSPEDCENGANVLLHSILEIDHSS